jgi:2,4-dienoyl-CoA reductase-like NADH-dependent reductase (Old Yellow Enzyme family)
MSKLFEPSVINGMELSNSFVRSATWEGMAAEDGSVTAKLTKTLVALAPGGVGLIGASHSYVAPEGQARPRQMGIYKDEFIEGIRKLTAEDHGAGASAHRPLQTVEHKGRLRMTCKLASGWPLAQLRKRSSCHKVVWLSDTSCRGYSKSGS